MKSAAHEDKQIQAVILQHMRNVEDLNEEGEVKSHLMLCLKDKEVNKNFRLNEYWKRPAIGVKGMALGDGSVKNAPEVAYFGRSCIGTRPSQWKFELTVLYTTASLMVFRLNYVCTEVCCMMTSALLPKEFGSFQLSPFDSIHHHVLTQRRPVNKTSAHGQRMTFSVSFTQVGSRNVIIYL